MKPSLYIATTALATFASITTAQWLPDYQIYSIQRIGLYDNEHTSNVWGLQDSSVGFITQTGYLGGYSNRYGSNQDHNGYSAWIWDGTTTNQVGFTSPDHTKPSGYRNTTIQYLSPAGQASGTTSRYTSTGISNGSNTWVWNGNGTTQIGSAGSEYTGSEGYQSSWIVHQNAAGQIIGNSYKYIDTRTRSGCDAWAWNNNTTTKIGLTSAPYTNSLGNQYNYLRGQTETGLVVGSTERVTTGDASNGSDTWIWNGSTTTQIGLTGGIYTGSGGYQSTNYFHIKNSGMAAGYSHRISGLETTTGFNAWVWDGSTSSVIGFTSAAHTGTGGYQRSYPQYMNDSGQIAGTSSRFNNLGQDNGNDAWVWNGTSTIQIGLVGGVYTRSTGRQISYPERQNEAGYIAGFSVRTPDWSTDNGRNVWVWNGTTTTQIGLTGSAHTGSAGYQRSELRYLTESNLVTGSSERITGVNRINGYDAWMWDGTTTTQMGLTGGVYTGSGGWQHSSISRGNESGVFIGSSMRYTGLYTPIGQDVWYFDPLTRITTPLIMSIRPEDNYAYSEPSLLTASGFLIGYYKYFVDGVGDGVDRAFVFRPDLGVTDLDNLVAGGLTSRGWSILHKAEFSDDLTTIVGYGGIIGNLYGKSAFVMTIPNSGTAALFSFGLLLSTLRRRT